MKLLTLLIGFFFFATSLLASDNGSSGVKNSIFSNVILQAVPSIQFQANDNAVTPQEGKTDNENVWVNRSLWIVLIAIIIAVYLFKRKKQ